MCKELSVGQKPRRDAQEKGHGAKSILLEVGIEFQVPDSDRLLCILAQIIPDSGLRSSHLRTGGNRFFNFLPALQSHAFAQ